MAALKLRIYPAQVLEAPFPKLSHLKGSLSQMIWEMPSLDRPIGVLWISEARVLVICPFSSGSGLATKPVVKTFKRLSESVTRNCTPCH